MQPRSVLYEWFVSAALMLAVIPLSARADDQGNWPQWRGPQRTGVLPAGALPESLDEATLVRKWSVSLGPSYSGPIVSGPRVFTTETRDKKYEVVTALDRETGKVLWQQKWEGSLSVPFFAKANGDWIRATPAVDDGRLYVAGIRDRLVCLAVDSGEILWQVDFPQQVKSPAPTFGFVSSPLVDGDAVYVQAGGGFCKLDKTTGELLWRGLVDGGGMNGSAFASPMIVELNGKRQAVVQTRTDLAGVDLSTGQTLWSQPIKAFRGMNIVTPTVYQNKLLTSTYGGTTQLLEVGSGDGTAQVNAVWTLPVQGYMTTPVIVGDFAYTHLKNQRMACFDLKNGKETWRTGPMGKYVSLIASGNRILGLDERGELMLFRANPQAFEVIDRRKVGDDSWAHVAVAGNQILVRNLDGLVAFEFSPATSTSSE